MMNVALNGSSEIIEIPVEGILPNPYQPRRLFERVALDELARSVRQYGVLQPICVRCLNGSVYELVMGERRLRASKLAGLKYIPAIVLDIGDRDSAALSLIENIQRQDLNYIEEAEAMRAVMNDFGYTQEELSHILGKSKSSVANKLRLLRLNGEVKDMLINNKLSENHAKALLRLSHDEARKTVLEKVTKYGLNVKRTEELVDGTIRNEKEIGVLKKRPRIKLCFRDVRLFTNTIKQAVEQMNNSGMETEYEIKQSDNLYEIKINIKTAGNIETADM
jgi:ParB family chromosome partitioning protein